MLGYSIRKFAAEVESIFLAIDPSCVPRFDPDRNVLVTSLPRKGDDATCELSLERLFEQLKPFSRPASSARHRSGSWWKVPLAATWVPRSSGWRRCG